MYPTDDVAACLVDGIIDEEIDLFTGLAVSRYTGNDQTENESECVRNSDISIRTMPLFVILTSFCVKEVCSYCMCNFH